MSGGRKHKDCGGRKGERPYKIITKNRRERREINNRIEESCAKEERKTKGQIERV